ncbi:hypothetical protein N752_24500 [Desulforamulus aquiferis]|nr:hypothetical protein [Desulforamulus aquiferis]RYD02493.1 hypothetical protein N752_24500 [Desulforamulus aquiferis]
MDFLTNNWGGLQWTTWVRFGDKESYMIIPKTPGLYRVKPIGRNQLAYIGQTGRSLYERLINQLIRNTLQEIMPFNDPHTAAPSFGLGEMLKD